MILNDLIKELQTLKKGFGGKCECFFVNETNSLKMPEMVPIKGVSHTIIMGQDEKIEDIILYGHSE